MQLIYNHFSVVKFDRYNKNSLKYYLFKATRLRSTLIQIKLTRRDKNTFWTALEWINSVKYAIFPLQLNRSQTLTTNYSVTIPQPLVV